MEQAESAAVVILTRGWSGSCSPSQDLRGPDLKDPFHAGICSASCDRGVPWAPFRGLILTICSEVVAQLPSLDLHSVGPGQDPHSTLHPSAHDHFLWLSQLVLSPYFPICLADLPAGSSGQMHGWGVCFLFPSLFGRKMHNNPNSLCVPTVGGGPKITSGRRSEIGPGLSLTKKVLTGSEGRV